MRLIDADVLKELIPTTSVDMFENCRNCSLLSEEQVLELIDMTPTIDQWIPCSERLPKEHESIWAKAKGTDRWSEAMWEKQSDEVIVTELFEDGTTRTDTACTHDGEWYVKVKIVKRKIIAWMPLPEPYEGGADDDRA